MSKLTLFHKVHLIKKMHPPTLFAAYGLDPSGDVMIQNGMTFTVDSDLKGESPQFTLTCTSTGGPATNVTWTRDSTAVSGGMMTVLDNPMNATYTHTLTVTGRVGGQYQCTVSNRKPSEAAASFTVQGKRECEERASERECTF